MKVGFYMQATEYVGVEFLSAVLKAAGHTTALFFDPRVWRDGITYDERLGRWFNIEDMIVEEILDSDVDVLGFSVVTDNYATALRVAGKLKQYSDVPTVFGGIHCTSVPERVVVKPQVDYVVVGEGEYPLLELVEAVERGERDVRIPNVWHRNAQNEVVSTPARPAIPDLDGLPYPDKGLFYDNVSPVHRKHYVTVASRGCLYACTYCNNSMYKEMYNKSGRGKWHRRRSVDNLMGELVQAHQAFGFGYIFFQDEIFIDNREWLEEFCDKYGKALGLPFWCYGYTKYVNAEVVAMLEDAGCNEMNVGVQSIRKETRKIIKRGDKNERIVETFELMRNSKIYLSTGNILQLPGQPIEEALETAEFYNENRVDRAIVAFLRYYPRTEIVKTGLKMGAITAEDVERLEEAEKENPFIVSTSKDARGFRKAHMLIMLTAFAPKFLVPFLIRSGMWRVLPSGTMTLLILSRLRDLRTRFTKKSREVETYTAWEFLMLMAKCGFDKLVWKWHRRSNRPHKATRRLASETRESDVHTGSEM